MAEKMYAKTTLSGRQLFLAMASCRVVFEIRGHVSCFPYSISHNLIALIKSSEKYYSFTENQSINLLGYLLGLSG